MVLGMLSQASGLFGATRAGGGDTAATTDTVSIRTAAPVTQSLGGGTMIERTDSWIWVAALAVLAVVVLRK